MKRHALVTAQCGVTKMHFVRVCVRDAPCTHSSFEQCKAVEDSSSGSVSDLFKVSPCSSGSASDLFKVVAVKLVQSVAGGSEACSLHPSDEHLPCPPVS